MLYENLHSAVSDKGWARFCDSPQKMCRLSRFVYFAYF